MPVDPKKRYICFKALKSGIDIIFWHSFALEGAMPILLKVVLFQSIRHGNPLDDATPNLIPYSSSSISGLSNEVSLVSEF
jgi:hypothetical protein